MYTVTATGTIGKYVETKTENDKTYFKTSVAVYGGKINGEVATQWWNLSLTQFIMDNIIKNRSIKGLRVIFSGNNPIIKPYTTKDGALGLSIEMFATSFEPYFIDKVATNATAHGETLTSDNIPF